MHVMDARLVCIAVALWASKHYIMQQNKSSCYVYMYTDKFSQMQRKFNLIYCYIYIADLGWHFFHKFYNEKIILCNSKLHHVQLLRKKRCNGS